MVATHDFYPMDPTIWMPIIAFSCVVVKWNVICFNLLFFSCKNFKISKNEWLNELSRIAGKWKFCRIYWQWILIEQTSLYTVVYRTFLYNPTNLKVPKKAPCKCFEQSSIHMISFACLVCFSERKYPHWFSSLHALCISDLVKRALV